MTLRVCLVLYFATVFLLIPTSKTQIIPGFISPAQNVQKSVSTLLLNKNPLAHRINPLQTRSTNEKGNTEKDQVDPALNPIHQVADDEYKQVVGSSGSLSNDTTVNASHKTKTRSPENGDDFNYDYLSKAANPIGDNRGSFKGASHEFASHKASHKEESNVESSYAKSEMMQAGGMSGGVTDSAAFRNWANSYMQQHPDSSLTVMDLANMYTNIIHESSAKSSAQSGFQNSMSKSSSLQNQNSAGFSQKNNFQDFNSQQNSAQESCPFAQNKANDQFWKSAVAFAETEENKMRSSTNNNQFNIWAQRYLSEHSSENLTMKELTSIYVDMLKKSGRSESQISEELTGLGFSSAMSGFQKSTSESKQTSEEHQFWSSAFSLAEQEAKSAQVSIDTNHFKSWAQNYISQHSSDESLNMKEVTNMYIKSLKNSEQSGSRMSGQLGFQSETKGFQKSMSESSSSQNQTVAFSQKFSSQQDNAMEQYWNSAITLAQTEAKNSQVSIDTKQFKTWAQKYLNEHSNDHTLTMKDLVSQYVNTLKKNKGSVAMAGIGSGFGSIFKGFQKSTSESKQASTMDQYWSSAVTLAEKEAKNAQVSIDTNQFKTWAQNYLNEHSSDHTLNMKELTSIYISSLKKSQQSDSQMTEQFGFHSTTKGFQKSMSESKQTSEQHQFWNSAFSIAEQEAKNAHVSIDSNHFKTWAQNYLNQHSSDTTLTSKDLASKYLCTLRKSGYFDSQISGGSAKIGFNSATNGFQNSMSGSSLSQFGKSTSFSQQNNQNNNFQQNSELDTLKLSQCTQTIVPFEIWAQMYLNEHPEDHTFKDILLEYTRQLTESKAQGYSNQQNFKQFFDTADNGASNFVDANFQSSKNMNSNDNQMAECLSKLTKQMANNKEWQKMLEHARQMTCSSKDEQKIYDKYQINNPIHKFGDNGKSNQFQGFSNPANFNNARASQAFYPLLWNAAITTEKDAQFKMYPNGQYFVIQPYSSPLSFDGSVLKTATDLAHSITKFNGQPFNSNNAPETSFSPMIQYPGMYSVSFRNSFDQGGGLGSFRSSFNQGANLGSFGNSFHQGGDSGSFSNSFDQGGSGSFRNAFNQGGSPGSFRNSFGQESSPESFRNSFNQGDGSGSFSNAFDQGGRSGSFRNSFNQDGSPGSFRNSFNQEGSPGSFRNSFNQEGSPGSFRNSFNQEGSPGSFRNSFDKGDTSGSFRNSFNQDGSPGSFRNTFDEEGSPGSFRNSFNQDGSPGPFRNSFDQEGSPGSFRNSFNQDGSPGSFRNSFDQEGSPGSFRNSFNQDGSPGSFRNSFDQEGSPGSFRNSFNQECSPGSVRNSFDQEGSPGSLRNSFDQEGNPGSFRNSFDQEGSPGSFRNSFGQESSPGSFRNPFNQDGSPGSFRNSFDQEGSPGSFRNSFGQESSPGSFRNSFNQEGNPGSFRNSFNNGGDPGSFRNSFDQGSGSFDNLNFNNRRSIVKRSDPPENIWDSATGLADNIAIVATNSGQVNAEQIRDSTSKILSSASNLAGNIGKVATNQAINMADQIVNTATNPALTRNRQLLQSSSPVNVGRIFPRNVPSGSLDDSVSQLASQTLSTDGTDSVNVGKSALAGNAKKVAIAPEKLSV